MTGDNVPVKLKKKAAMVGIIVLFLVFGAVACSWIYLIFQLTAVSDVQEISLHRYMSVFSFGLAILCAAVWLADQIGILALKPEVEKRIWYALIVGVLSSLVTTLTSSLT